MNREDYIVDKDDADAIKAFELQRNKMDEVLTRTYDLGQLNALEVLINAVDDGTWDNLTYERVVAVRDALERLMQSDSNIHGGEKQMTPKRCDNCLYEYSCTWEKAGGELKCEEWKPEEGQEGNNAAN